jgi:hypothetical protein
MMLNPPTRVDTLISADYVLTMNDNYDTYYPGAIAITDDSIVGVGVKTDLEETGSLEAGKRAERKATLIGELLKLSNIPTETLIKSEYHQLTQQL